MNKTFAITIRANDEEDMNDTDETSVTAVWRWVGTNKFNGTVSTCFSIHRGHITLATDDPKEYASIKKMVYEEQRLRGGIIEERTI